MKYTFIIVSLLIPVILSAQVSKITINSGNAGSATTLHTSFNNNLIMFANDGIHGNELWMHDGTSATMIKDINPGAGNSYSAFLWPGMGILNNTLYFNANDGSGSKLWKYDGITASIASTAFVLSDAAFYAALNGKVYFSGDELNVYDPANNTVQVAADINQNGTASYTNSLFIWQNKLYFSANTASNGVELIVYDPVTNIASMVADINIGSSGSYPARFVAVNNKLYFTATTALFGNELYSYDGINAPQRLTDINPGIGNGIPLFLNRMCVFDNAIYFSGTTGSSNYGLYKYDYMNNNAIAVSTLPTGYFYNPDWFVVYANKLFFNAQKSSTDFRVFAYDGVNDPYNITNTDLQNTGGLTTANNHLYFIAIPFTSLDDELYMYYDSSLTIKPISFPSNIHTYPNPVISNVYFDIVLNQPIGISISITDMQGREMYYSGMKEYTTSKHTVVVPMQYFAPGTYVYSINDSSRKTLLKRKTCEAVSAESLLFFPPNDLQVVAIDMYYKSSPVL